MDLRTIQVRPHPAREIFRKHGIKLSVVSKTLGLSYPHLCAMLSGSLRVTPKNEAKLKMLCRNLEKE